MKAKYIIIILLAGTGLFATSCKDYLSVDQYFADRQSETRIFNSRDYTEQWLANCYNQLLDYNLEIGHKTYTVSNYADDIFYNEGGNGAEYRRFKFGEYDFNWYKQSWSQSYAGIRQASVMINSMAEGGTFTVQQVAQYKAEARFIRAYLYWLLLRKYGPVPIMPENGVDYDQSYANLSTPRNTYDEVVDFISSEMVLAAKDLPMKQDNRNIARPTRGAALATRAKALLFAASPLANGNSEMADFVDDAGKSLISQQYSEEKWAKAAAAAKDVIDLNVYRLYTAERKIQGTESYPVTIVPPYHAVYSDKNFPEGWANIDPFESYRALFNGDLYAAENPEMIFTRGENQTDEEHGVIALTRHQMPQVAGGWNCHGLTLKQSDAYDMADGSAFNRAEILQKYGSNMFVQSNELDQFKPLKVDVWKEFAHREPRFYASVGFSGALWTMSSATNDPNNNTNKQVFYYRGNSEGRVNSDRWLPTGIGMMKYVNPKDNANNGGRIYPKVEIAIRYADILLMYAESLNELSGSYNIPSWDGATTYMISRDINTISEAVSPVRIRAGVPDYEMSVYMEQSMLRNSIKHERQLELLGENQRYYDLRRWKDAPVEDAKQIYGYNTLITKQNAALFYSPVRVPLLQTSFSKKMYFWPIDWDELRKNNRMTQTPGWPSFD
ncbi:RagB/SusD family nutrient uptake outer membrane protein [Arcticibacter eurypsychrophilus]|uniref:RagB/SusD family nutrient uptake outer membrane protein n=1 Tax=Arcticibacter eurypsychrophilus TaxID=1434752 RepID=UPI00084D3082|nr:RagB/SusD family nutrient uptake outer membrane protein [Arcticibacter eurypsychrophilus]